MMLRRTPNKAKTQPRPVLLTLSMPAKGCARRSLQLNVSARNLQLSAWKLAWRTDLLVAAISQSDRRRDLLNQAEEQRSALLPAVRPQPGGIEEAVAALDMDALPAQLADLESRQLEFERQKQECAGRALDLERDFQLHESSAALSQAATDKQAAGARIVDLAEGIWSSRLPCGS